jgi:hypothetical protein
VKVISAGLLLGLTLFVVGIFMSTQGYQPQPDVRKKEYYPVEVVNKYQTESCDKYNRCTRLRYVVVNNGVDYIDVRTDADSYESVSIGSMISFEKHLVDPKELGNNMISGLLVFVGGAMFVYFTFVVMVKED